MKRNEASASNFCEDFLITGQSGSAREEQKWRLGCTYRLRGLFLSSPVAEEDAAAALGSELPPTFPIFSPQIGELWISSSCFASHIVCLNFNCLAMESPLMS